MAATSSVPASGHDGEPRDAEVHPGLERAHVEAAVHGGSRLGRYVEPDIARDDGAVRPPGVPERRAVQGENRYRLPADGRGELVRVRVDDEGGKRDALAAVAEGQRSSVVNGSDERRYDDLAAADREAQRCASGCRGDGGNGDAGLLE